jgi:hypothetical protein
MRSIGRLLVLLAVLLPVGVVASSAANGAGNQVVECSFFKGKLIPSPGLTQVPANQTVVGHGRLYGCNRAGGGATFSATLRMAHATCADLSMVGDARFDWANGQSSSAALNLAPQFVEPTKVFITGTVGSGMFAGLLVHAWVRFTEVFGGTGPGCTDSNPLKLISFTNTQSYRLLAPRTTTSTVPQHLTTTTHPPASSTSTSAHTSTSASTAPRTSTSATTATTVAITVAGSTADPTTTHQAAGGATTAPPGGSSALVVGQGPGGLALTGNNNFGALVGLESLIVGGALACFARDRRTGRAARARRSGARSWLSITLPPSS